MRLSPSLAANNVARVIAVIVSFFFLSHAEPCKTRYKPALALPGPRIRVFPGRAPYRRAGLTGRARPCDTLRPCYYPAG